mmetsp:Transcript_239/g.599  ORF Transcript_239/g.599 Transcript_239/m.599 type:complete len:185 (+) Transcript_239:1011-1565(+)
MKTTIDTRKMDIDEDLHQTMKARSSENKQEEGCQMRGVQSFGGTKEDGLLMKKVHIEKHLGDDDRQMIGVQKCEGGGHPMKAAPEDVTSAPPTQIESSQADGPKGGEMVTQVAHTGVMIATILAILLTAMEHLNELVLGGMTETERGLLRRSRGSIVKTTRKQDAKLKRGIVHGTHDPKTEPRN